jgi:hypothetical protein
VAGRAGRSRVALRPKDAAPLHANLGNVSLSQPFSDLHLQHVATPGFHTSGVDEIATLELQKRLLVARNCELEDLLRRCQIDVPFCDPYLKSILDDAIWIQA